TQQGSTPSVLAGDTLYIDSAVGSGGHEPWRINLSTGAIGVLRDILPGGASSNPTKFFALDKNHGAGFFAYDTPGHYAMYASNGTPEGTRLVSRLTGVTTQFSPKSIGSRVFMVGSGTLNNASIGMEPYAVDLCPADYDNSGAANVDDLFAYLNDWFVGSIDADLTGAAGTPDIADLMAFVTIWLTPCDQ
ncbi:MAG: GC-type dockerin domain-anchored protein, partial [Myxococcota bacterium]